MNAEFARSGRSVWNGQGVTASPPHSGWCGTVVEARWLRACRDERTGPCEPRPSHRRLPPLPIQRMKRHKKVAAMPFVGERFFSEWSISKA